MCGIALYWYRVRISSFFVSFPACIVQTGWIAYHKNQQHETLSSRVSSDRGDCLRCLDMEMLMLCHRFLLVFYLELLVVWVAAVSVAYHRQPREGCPFERGSEVSLCGSYSFGKGLEHVLYCAMLKVVTLFLAPGNLWPEQKSNYI